MSVPAPGSSFWLSANLGQASAKEPAAMRRRPSSKRAWAAAWVAAPPCAWARQGANAQTAGRRNVSARRAVGKRVLLSPGNLPRLQWRSSGRSSEARDAPRAPAGGVAGAGETVGPLRTWVGVAVAAVTTG